MPDNLDMYFTERREEHLNTRTAFVISLSDYVIAFLNLFLLIFDIFRFEFFRKRLHSVRASNFCQTDPRKT